MHSNDLLVGKVGPRWARVGPSYAQGSTKFASNMFFKSSLGSTRRYHIYICIYVCGLMTLARISEHVAPSSRMSDHISSLKFTVMMCACMAMLVLLMLGVRLSVRR